MLVNVKLAGPTQVLMEHFFLQLLLRGSGAATQTGGVCKLFNAMVDHAANGTTGC